MTEDKKKCKKVIACNRTPLTQCQRYASVWCLPTAAVITLVITGHFHFSSPAAWWTQATEWLLRTGSDGWEYKADCVKYMWRCVCGMIIPAINQIPPEAKPQQLTTTHPLLFYGHCLTRLTDLESYQCVLSTFSIQHVGERHIINTQMVLVCVWNMCARVVQGETGKEMLKSKFFSRCPPSPWNTPWRVNTSTKHGHKIVQATQTQVTGNLFI